MFLPLSKHLSEYVFLKDSRNKRISGHKYKIHNVGNQLLYKHFNSTDHFIFSTRLRILEENKYHNTNNPNLRNVYTCIHVGLFFRIKLLKSVFIFQVNTTSRKFRTAKRSLDQDTEQWFSKWCNDNVENVVNFTNPHENNVNMIGLFDNTQVSYLVLISESRINWSDVNFL